MEISKGLCKNSNQLLNSI